MDAPPTPPVGPAPGPHNVLSLFMPGFSRTHEEFPLFLQCLQMKFAINPIKYGPDFIKVIFTMSKMMKDYTTEWATQATLVLATEPDNISWATFKQQLKDTFNPAANITMAI